MGIRARAHKRAFVLTFAALTGSTGCQLIGYDVLGRRDDAGGFVTVQTADAEAPVSLDADVRGDGDANVVDANVVDANVVDANVVSAASDSGATGQADAHVDSGAVCTGALNACGGCSTLASALNASCGLCGAGHYACDGTDSLLCSGASPAPRASGGTVLIDDFEDGDSIPKAASGTDGYWSVYSDGTAGTLTPPAGSRITPSYAGAAGTARSAHVSGGGFTAFGAGLILWPNAQQCAFDVSAEQGISFWLKGTATVEVALATTEALSPPGPAAVRNDFYRKTYPLTSTWTHYTLPWSELKQAGWGTVVPFVPSHVEYFQFSFGANVTFDLYLDEISFY